MYPKRMALHLTLATPHTSVRGFPRDESSWSARPSKLRQRVNLVTV